MCSPVSEQMWKENETAGLTLQVLARKTGYCSVSFRPNSSFQKGFLFLSKSEHKSDDHQPVGSFIRWEQWKILAQLPKIWTLDGFVNKMNI